MLDAILLVSCMLRINLCEERLLFCWHAPIQEEACYEDDDDGHGHDAPHEGLIGFADVVSHCALLLSMLLYKVGLFSMPAAMM